MSTLENNFEEKIIEENDEYNDDEFESYSDFVYSHGYFPLSYEEQERLKRERLNKKV